MKTYQYGQDLENTKKSLLDHPLLNGPRRVQQKPVVPLPVKLTAEQASARRLRPLTDEERTKLNLTRKQL